MKLLFENWRKYLTEDETSISDLMSAVSNLKGDMKFDDKTHGEWIEQHLPEFSVMWRGLNETTI